MVAMDLSAHDPPAAITRDLFAEIALYIVFINKTECREAKFRDCVASALESAKIKRQPEDVFENVSAFAIKLNAQEAADLQENKIIKSLELDRHIPIFKPQMQSQ